MGSTLAGFFVAGGTLVLSGAICNWNAHLPFPGWRREFNAKYGPRLWRWGVGVWVAGIAFFLLATVPLIAVPALVFWVVTQIAKR